MYGMITNCNTMICDFCGRKIPASYTDCDRCRIVREETPAHLRDCLGDQWPGFHCTFCGASRRYATRKWPGSRSERQKSEIAVPFRPLYHWDRPAILVAIAIPILLVVVLALLRLQAVAVPLQSIVLGLSTTLVILSIALAGLSLGIYGRGGFSALWFDVANRLVHLSRCKARPLVDHCGTFCHCRKSDGCFSRADGLLMSHVPSVAILRCGDRGETELRFFRGPGRIEVPSATQGSERHVAVVVFPDGRIDGMEPDGRARHYGEGVSAVSLPPPCAVKHPIADGGVPDRKWSDGEFVALAKPPFAQPGTVFLAANGSLPILRGIAVVRRGRISQVSAIWQAGGALRWPCQPPKTEARLHNNGSCSTGSSHSEQLIVRGLAGNGASVDMTTQGLQLSGGKGRLYLAACHIPLGVTVGIASQQAQQSEGSTNG